MLLTNATCCWHITHILCESNLHIFPQEIFAHIVNIAHIYMQITSFVYTCHWPKCSHSTWLTHEVTKCCLDTHMMLHTFATNAHRKAISATSNGPTWRCHTHEIVLFGQKYSAFDGIHACTLMSLSHLYTIFDVWNSIISYMFAIP